MNEEIHCITNEGKTARNEWENGDSDNLGQFFSILYLLYIVLLQVINILKS